MLVCALTLYIVVGCVQLFSISTIDTSMVLLAWLLCWVGCFICVLITYRQLRRSVNMCVGSLGFFVVICFNVMGMVISSALKMVCNLGSLFDIYTSAFVG